MTSEADPIIGDFLWGKSKAGKDYLPTGKDYAQDQERYIAASWNMLNAMTLKDRTEIQNILWKKGLGSTTKPSVSGLTPVDINRFAEFLVFTRTQKNKTGANATPQEAYNTIFEYE